MSANQAVPEPKNSPSDARPEVDGLPLIQTKIRVPRRRADLLSRSRLVDFIHAHLDRKLILISAPAGYGKTSLLSDFAHDTELPVCWYTLDRFDCDLNVFLEHLIASIARRFPGFGVRSRAFLQNITNPGQNLYLTVATIVQEIYDAIPEYFVLILDDHHSVEDQDQINEFLDLFVTYVDENCHLFLASRRLPALPNLSLLVARRQAAGLSIDELRFTPDEVQDLARRNYGVEVTSEQAEALVQRTGGWITGLLLTDVPHWVEAQDQTFSQGRINVGLHDYFERQVLAEQPGPLREFLLASSVLDELSPGLCTQALGIENTARLMQQVRDRGLFVIDYEGDDNRLRYHDLFREYLLESLQQRDEEQFRSLTRRAADTYADRGEWERAISRYLGLKEYEVAAEIIQDIAMEHFSSGRWDTLTGWIDALPETMLADRPRFLELRGKVLVERGEPDRAMDFLERAELAYESKDNRTGLARILGTKSILLRIQGHYEQALVQCERVLALVEGKTEQEKLVMGLAYRNAALCQFRLGRLAEGQESSLQALRYYEELEDHHNAALVYHDLGLSRELAGDLEGAVDYYGAALQSWKQLGLPGPWANSLNGLGVVYYLQGRYDEAQPVLNEALTRAQQAGDLRVEAYAWASLGDLHRDLGAYERAQQAYTQALELARRTRTGFLLTYILDALGNTWRLQGDLEQAGELLAQALKHAAEHRSAYEQGLCHTSLGILAGAEDELLTAQHHLSLAAEGFESGGFLRDLARAHLHQAQTAFLGDDREKALGYLQRTLEISGDLASDQFLVVDGLDHQRMLHHALEQKVGQDILPDLLVRIQRHERRMAPRPKAAAEARPQPSLVIHAFGQPRVILTEERVKWATSQSRDVLFCLLQHPDGLRKEDLAGFFWPDHAPLKLDSIFRSTLYRLRRALFRSSVIYENGLYRFNRESDYWFDVEAFESKLDNAYQVQNGAREHSIGVLQEAIGLYSGNYLEDVYGDWCELERERLRGRYLEALEILATRLADRRDLPQALEVYQRMLVLDPYQEAAYRGLMYCYYRLGDRANAIRQYQQCAEILREELGLSPSSKTEDLYLEIIG